MLVQMKVTLRYILSRKYQSIVFSVSFRVYYYRCTFAVFKSNRKSTLFYEDNFL